MIKEIFLKNFFSFQDEKIDIDTSVNVLIGINGSGKSNFIKALKLLVEGVSGNGLYDYLTTSLGAFEDVFFKAAIDSSKRREISIRYVFDGEKLTKQHYGVRFTDDVAYEIRIVNTPGNQNYFVEERALTIKSDGSDGFEYLLFNNGIGFLSESHDGGPKLHRVRYNDGNPRELRLRSVDDSQRYFHLTTLKKAIQDIVVYDYFDTTPLSKIRQPAPFTDEDKLISTGVNLAQVLNYINRTDDTSYQRICTALKEINPYFRELVFNLNGVRLSLFLKEHGLNSAVNVYYLSDGTLRYLCLLAILYNPKRGMVVCIDEPEVGLHPDMIYNIAKAIKEASKTSTIIISTHEDRLLDFFELRQLRVFEKDEHNASKVLIHTEENFVEWDGDYTNSELWRSGELGGVRYGA